MKENSVAKEMKKVKFREQQIDFAYWQSQPPIARKVVQFVTTRSGKKVPEKQVCTGGAAPRAHLFFG